MQSEGPRGRPLCGVLLRLRGLVGLGLNGLVRLDRGRSASRAKSGEFRLFRLGLFQRVQILRVVE